MQTKTLDINQREDSFPQFRAFCTEFYYQAVACFHISLNYVYVGNFLAYVIEVCHKTELHLAIYLYTFAFKSYA